MTAEIVSSVPFDWMIVFDSILLHVAFQRLNVLLSDGRLYIIQCIMYIWSVGPAVL